MRISYPTTVGEEEHAHAFTVATALQVDLLAEIRSALDTALAEGQTFAQFREALEPRLRQRGWWGTQQVTDPQTGEERVALLGSPSRLRLILNANVSTAYAAWQWARIERVQAARSYLSALRHRRGRPRAPGPRRLARADSARGPLVDHPLSAKVALLCGATLRCRAGAAGRSVACPAS